MADPRDEAVQILRECAATLEFASPECRALSVRASNAADMLYIWQRDRLITKREAKPKTWRVEALTRVGHGQRERAAPDLESLSVVVEKVNEANARMAFDIVDARAANGDPTLPRPLILRLMNGETMVKEIEWR